MRRSPHTCAISVPRHERAGCDSTSAMIAERVRAPVDDSILVSNVMFLSGPQMRTSKHVRRRRCVRKRHGAGEGVARPGHHEASPCDEENPWLSGATLRSLGRRSSR